MLLSVALLGAACSGGGDDPAPAAGDGAPAPSPTTTIAASTDADEPTGADSTTADEPFSTIGDGIAITMARSDEPAGRFQAEVVRQLLGELGYTVNEPGNLELAPEAFYRALARGEVDLWAHGRFPEHEPLLDLVVNEDLPVNDQRDEPADDGETTAADGEASNSDGDTSGDAEPAPEPTPLPEIVVRDELSVVGPLVPEGSIAGFVTNASIAAAHPGMTFDTIVDDDELFARYDAADVFLSPGLLEDPDTDTGDGAAAGDDGTDDAPPEPTDGVIQILGCPEDAACADQIDEMIRFAGWRRVLDQVHGDHELLVEEALRRIAADQPVIIFISGPSADLTRLIAGENVLWLGFEPGSVLDGSITKAWSQRVDGESVPFAGDPATCTADPCHLGWLSHTITITARTEFLDRNPAAAELLALIEIPGADVSAADARLRLGDLRSPTADRSATAASDWIATNRDLVDEWLRAAVAAG